MYVRLCVCVNATAQTSRPVSIKFSTKDLKDICEVCFFGFRNYKINNVIEAISYVFLCGTLTVAILLRFSLKFKTR